MLVTTSEKATKTVLHASYFPGAVRSVPFVVFGVLFLRSLVSEFRTTSSSRLTSNNRTATQGRSLPTSASQENQSLPLLVGG